MERTRKHELDFQADIEEAPHISPKAVYAVLRNIADEHHGYHGCGFAWFQKRGDTLYLNYTSTVIGIIDVGEIEIKERTLQQDDSRIGAVALGLVVLRTATHEELDLMLDDMPFYEPSTKANERRTLTFLVRALLPHVRRSRLLAADLKHPVAEFQDPGANTGGTVDLPYRSKSLHDLMMKMFRSIPEVEAEEGLIRVRQEFARLVDRVDFERVRQVWNEELVKNVQSK